MFLFALSAKRKKKNPPLRSPRLCGEIKNEGVILMTRDGIVRIVNEFNEKSDNLGIYN